MICIYPENTPIETLLNILTLAGYQRFKAHEYTKCLLKSRWQPSLKIYQEKTSLQSSKS